MKHLLLTTIAAVVLVGCGELSSELLIQSVRDGNIEAVKQHLAAGADVNAKYGLTGETPLHDAAYGGHKEIAELLIANGANVNAKSESVLFKGRTPLDSAEGETEIADLLRKHGGKTKKELKAEGK